MNLFAVSWTVRKWIVTDIRRHEREPVLDRKWGVPPSPQLAIYSPRHTARASEVSLFKSRREVISLSRLVVSMSAFITLMSGCFPLSHLMAPVHRHTWTVYMCWPVSPQFYYRPVLPEEALLAKYDCFITLLRGSSTFQLQWVFILRSGQSVFFSVRTT